MANLPPTSPPQDLVRSEKGRKPSVPEQWDLAWAEFGREHPGMKRLSGVAAFLIFTVLGQSVLGLIQLVSPVLPLIAWPLMFLATTVLAQMFVINFSGKAYNRRIVALEERFRPILTIIFKPNQAPFQQVYPGRQGQVTQYRVCVVSPNPITDVELVVNKLEIGGVDHSGYHLRPRHERDSKRGGTKRVALKPFKEDAWDVVSTHPNDGVILSTISALGLIIIPPGKYEFELMASGGNNPPATRIATLEVRADNSLSFDIREGRLSELLI